MKTRGAHLLEDDGDRQSNLGPIVGLRNEPEDVRETNLQVVNRGIRCDVWVRDRAGREGSAHRRRHMHRQTQQVVAER